VAMCWDAKHRIEDLVRNSGLKWTILRPAPDFNFLELAAQGALLSAYGLDIKLRLLAEGAFAARALLQPNVFNAKEITLGAQSLGLEEIAGCLSEV
jgi:uncharacterized protein YbjT (DUF2867 family)